MNYRALKDLMQFTVGKNKTRIKDSSEDVFTPGDFERSLHNMDFSGEITGCIINLIKSKAAPLSNKSEKCITSNFLKCVFDVDILDPWFFCYQFNESKMMEQQISMLHQGTTLSVKKLNIKSVGELNISLPDIKRQRLIGALYKESIIQKDLMLRQVENMSKMTLAVISKIEED